MFCFKRQLGESRRNSYRGGIDWHDTIEQAGGKGRNK